jgi:hypothetical protein
MDAVHRHALQVKFSEMAKHGIFHVFESWWFFENNV